MFLQVCFAFSSNTSCQYPSQHTNPVPSVGHLYICRSIFKFQGFFMHKKRKFWLLSQLVTLPYMATFNIVFRAVALSNEYLIHTPIEQFINRDFPFLQNHFRVAQVLRISDILTDTTPVIHYQTSAFLSRLIPRPLDGTKEQTTASYRYFFNKRCPQIRTRYAPDALWPHHGRQKPHCLHRWYLQPVWSKSMWVVYYGLL